MPDISNGEKTYLCVRSHGLKANAVMNLLLEFSMMLFCFEPARAGGRCWTGRGGLLWLRLECGSLWFFLLSSLRKKLERQVGVERIIWKWRNWITAPTSAQAESVGKAHICFIQLQSYRYSREGRTQQGPFGPQQVDSHCPGYLILIRKTRF